MTIPFVDLYAQYLTLQSEIDAAIHQVITGSHFIRGPHVDEFESRYATLVGRTHCVSCANGTDSLYIAMKSLGIKPGDEVIAPAHSWISTTETITQAGGKVIFCDTDADSYTIDSRQIEQKITSRTVGIIPVHLYGHPANMPEIMAIATRHRLWVIEDCAQSHLAQIKGQMIGTFGDAASYSFYPGKNLGAMGDAGCIVTNDAMLAEKMAMYARHGGLQKGDHRIEGVNSRLDGLQAAILNVKIPHLQRWTEMRQANAKRYTERLLNSEQVVTPRVKHDAVHVWHLYVIQHPRRDALARYLQQRGIQTVINYPTALPFLPAYERYKHVPADFPNAYRHQGRILSLPMFAEITTEQQLTVCDAIDAFDQGNLEAA